MTEYTIQNRADYDSSFALGKKTIKCYSNEKMRELYPDGSYELSGESFAGNKKAAVGSLSAAGLTLPVSEAGSNSSFLYKGQKYVNVGGDCYVVLLESRATVVGLAFLGVALVAVLTALLFLSRSGKDEGVVLAPDFDTLPVDTSAQNVGEKLWAVSGTVTEENAAAEGVRITVLSGEEVIAEAVTDENGQFTLPGIKKGVFTLLLEKDGCTVTELLRVNLEDVELTLTLPGKQRGAVVRGSAGVLAGGLSRAAAGLNPGETLVLTADKLEDVTGRSAVSADDPVKRDQLALSEGVPDVMSINYYGFAFSAETADGGSRELKRSAGLLELVLPFNTSVNESIIVFRCVDGVVTALTDITGEDVQPQEGQFTAAGGNITVYTDTPGTYAVIYHYTGKVTHGSVSMGFQDKATVHLSSGTVDMYYYHSPDATHNAVVQLIADRDGAEYLLAQSGTILPGYSLNTMTLDPSVKLSQGSYNGRLRLLFFNGEDETTNMNTDIPLTIGVLND